MATLGLIVLAFLSVVIVAPLLSILAMPLFGAARTFRSAAPALMILTSALPMAGAMYLFVLLVSGIGREATLLMFLVPFLLVVRNDLDRIHRARTGDTPIRASLESQGENYDP